MHYVKLPMRISYHTKQCRFLLTQLGHYPVVLGIKWLQLHDVRTDTVRGMVGCTVYCLSATKREEKRKLRTILIQNMWALAERSYHLLAACGTPACVEQTVILPPPLTCRAPRDVLILGLFRYI